MFDIGFAEILLILGLGLLVLGPERLPGTVRTGLVWWKRLRASLESAKRQVEEEINYTEMTDKLAEYKQSAASLAGEITSATDIHKINEQAGIHHAKQSQQHDAVTDTTAAPTPAHPTRAKSRATVSRANPRAGLAPKVATGTQVKSSSKGKSRAVATPHSRQSTTQLNQSTKTGSTGLKARTSAAGATSKASK